MQFTSQDHKPTRSSEEMYQGVTKEAWAKIGSDSLFECCVEMKKLEICFGKER